MRRLALISIFAFFTLLVSSQIVFAEGGIAWPVSTPVCTKSGDQLNIRMAPDGSGGAIIVWEDYRRGEPDIYAQKINGIGDRLWGDEYGVAVCTASYGQKNPVIVSDGSGGAIIAWEDYRNVTTAADIYAQRINDVGIPEWNANGVCVSSGPIINMINPDIVSDGYGGAVIVWQESDGSNWWIRAQRIGFNGNLLWVGAQTLSQGVKPKEFPKIINDGTGYVIVTWQDYASGTYGIYAYRMDINNGTKHPSWLLNGNPVSIVTTSDQKGPEIVPDGSGGAIITWTDCRNDNGDIYAQWISSGGVRLWDAGYGNLEGIPVCKMQGEQKNPVIVSRLSAGTTVGAIFSWEDKRVDPKGDIYATGIDLDIGPGWNGEDVPIATGEAIQMCPRLVNDSQGGGIGAWRESSLLTSQWQIFATKRGQDGVLLWNSYPGVLVCQDSGIMEHQIVSDGSGGIIVAWQATGDSGSYDIFAQRVIEGASTRSASISGRVTLSDGENGITGVEVWALQGEKVISSCITDTEGYYGIVGLVQGSAYLVRANWRANDIESSVSKEAFAPSYSFNFTLEKDYLLGTIAGNVSGVEREAKRVSASAFKNSLSSGNGTAFVELEQNGKVIVRVPLEIDGNYSIPNLLPGRFVARAYNGSIYSSSRMVQLKEGETLRVDFAFGIMPEETVFNYPNPAKDGSTTITYYCGYTDPEAEIKIYNISGELVRKVEDNEIDGTYAPIYRFLWDCKNNSGREIASGIYIYAVEVKEKGGNGSKKVMKRMAVIR